MPDIDTFDFETRCLHSNAMPFPVCFFERTGQVVFVNQAFGEKFGTQLIGCDFYSNWSCTPKNENDLRNGDYSGFGLIRPKPNREDVELFRHDWNVCQVGPCFMAVCTSKSNQESKESRPFTFQFSASGKVFWADQESEALFGCTGSERFVGNSIFEFVGKSNRTETISVFAKSILNRNTFCLDVRVEGVKVALNVCPKYDGDQFICFSASKENKYEELFYPDLGRLVAGMSHDLKSPLNSILGFSRLLLGADLDAEYDQYARSIESGGRELLEMITDLVDLAKILSDNVSIEYEWLSVFQLVRELDVEVKYASDGTSCRLCSMELDGQNWEVELDVVRFKKLVLRIFTFLCNENMDLSVGVDEVGIEARFTLKLQCKSVGDVAVDLLPFSSEVPARSNSKHRPSNDFNIIVIREAVRSLGGEFVQDDDDPSLLKIVFRSIQVRALDREKLPSSFLEHDLFMFKPISVLGVDDSSLNRLLFEKLFKDTPHSLVVVSSAEAALDYLSKEKVDVIISDICMPEMDGIEMAAEIERTVGAICPKIIFVSSDQMDLKKRVSRTLQYGFVEKPATTESLAVQLLKLGLEVPDSSMAELDTGKPNRNSVKLLSSCKVSWPELKQSLACFKCGEWRTFRERMDLDELEAFADELYEFGANKKSEEICHVASGVKSYLKEFDLASLGRVLEDIEVTQL